MAKLKLQPVAEWMKEGFGYVIKNWAMLFKVYGWGILTFIGAEILIMIGIGFGSLIAGALNLSWSILTGVLVFTFGIFGFLYLIAMAGRMIYLFLLASKEPINNIRETWKKINLRDGLSTYWVLLLAVFAGYGGMVFLIIPGLIVFTWVSIAIFLRVEENVKGLRALMLSRDYVRNYFWNLVGRFVLLTILMGVVFFPIIWGFMKLVDMGGMYSVLGFVIYIASLGVMIGIPYRLLYTTYLDLVRIKGKLELKTTTWRTFGWGFLAFSPLLLMFVSMIILIAVNPAKQIQKAKDAQVQQQIMKLR